MCVCAACPIPRLNQGYELRPPWEQHLRYVPHRVCNGYNIAKVITCESVLMFVRTEGIRDLCDCVRRKSSFRSSHFKCTELASVLHNIWP